MARPTTVALRTVTVVLTSAMVLSGCGDGSDGVPSPSPAAPGTAPGGTSSAVASSTGTGPATTTATGTAAVDCAAVDSARQELTDVTNAELARLGVDRSDPRAFPVQVLVTSQQSAEYWTAVRDALTDAGLRATADVVVAYWQPLDPELDAIQIADGSEASLQEATRRYTEVRGSAPDDDVVAAQQRLDEGIAAACGAASASPSS